MQKEKRRRIIHIQAIYCRLNTIMRVYNLSSNPNEPCFVVQFNKLSIMLDCGLDMSPFMHYLPLPVVEKTQQHPPHNPDLFNDELRDLGIGTTLGK